MKKLKLQKGKYNPKGDKYAFVDDEDYPLLSRFQWRLFCPSRKYLAVYTRLGKSHIYLCHLVFGRRIKGNMIDHIDRNPLNNQKNNLREVGALLNVLNRSPHPHLRYRGLCLERGKWAVRFTIPGTTSRYIGRFNSKKEAASEWNRLADLHYGSLISFRNPV